MRTNYEKWHPWRWLACWIVLLFAVTLEVNAIKGDTFIVGGVTYYEIETNQLAIIHIGSEAIDSNGECNLEQARKNANDSAKMSYLNAVAGQIYVVNDASDKIKTIVQLGEGRATKDCDLSLKKITEVPSTVTALDQLTSTTMTTFVMPASVIPAKVNSRVFSKLSNCRYVEVAEGTTAFKVVNNVLYSQNGEKLYFLPCKDPRTTFDVPEGTTKIMLNSIQGDTLITINIPRSVTDIETSDQADFCPYTKKLQKIGVDPDNDFYYNPVITNENGDTIKDENGQPIKDSVLCKKPENAGTLIKCPRAKVLTDNQYTVPNGITTIGLFAFYGVSNLSAIDLGGVVTMEESAFNNCNNLTTVTIPATLTGKIKGSFVACSNFSEYIVVDDNEEYMSENGIVFTKKKNPEEKRTLLFYPPGKKDTDYTIPNDVEKIEEEAFQECNLTKVTITENVDSIKGHAFWDAKKLQEVVFEEGLKYIGGYCFHNTIIETIDLPASLKTIANRGFEDCKNLTTVTVAENSQLETIGDRAFFNCAKLEEFSFGEISGDSDVKLKVGEKAFSELKNLKTVTLPKTLESIGVQAFFQSGDALNGLNVTFPKSSKLVSFADKAFADSKINSIAIPDSIVIPEGIKTIGEAVFRNCTIITEVKLPASLESIDPQAFLGCSDLGYIDVDSENENYASADGFLCTKDLSKLVIFPPGKSRNEFSLLPPSLTRLGDHSFFGCTEVQKVCIPKKVVSLGLRTFGNTTYLGEIAFLGDSLIDPENIQQDGPGKSNASSFDDGIVNPEDRRGNITIYLRKKAYDDYMTNHDGKAGDPYYEFYKKFHQPIKCMDVVPHEGDAADLTSPANYGDEYFVMDADPDQGKAMFLSTTADVETFVLTDSVSINGNTYSVGIGDYAFEGANSHINEVVVKGKVDYVGAMAFMTDATTLNVSGNDTVVVRGSNPTSIKQVIFTANEPADIATNRFFSSSSDGLKENFQEFGKAGEIMQSESPQMIYVKASREEDYENSWKFYNSNQIDYRIPGISITSRYGTFSREFDVDLSHYTSQRGNGKKRVLAFTDSNDGIREGTGDFGGKTEHYVLMHSINEGEAGDGTYIPAGTGVLLCAIDENRTASDFYYTIGEEDINTPVESVMKPVTVNPKTVTSDGDIYVMSGGLFYPVQSGRSVDMPIHKAYLWVSGANSANGAKVAIRLYLPEGVVTSIDDSLTEVPSGDAKVFDLQGRRVLGSGMLKPGIYIVDGKKKIVK